VPADAYAAVVDADVPVAAGAVVVRAGRPAGPLKQASTDIAWSAATRPLTGNAVAAVPRVSSGTGAFARLVLTASADASVTVTEAAANGRILHQGRVAVPAGKTVSVWLGRRTAGLGLGTDAAVHAALVLEVPDPGGALVGVLPIAPPVDAVRVAPPVTHDPALGARR
jgi:hypothetical protein